MASLLAARWLDRSGLCNGSWCQRTLLQALAHVPSLVRILSLTFLPLFGIAPLFKDAFVQLAPGLLALGTDKLWRERTCPLPIAQ